MKRLEENRLPPAKATSFLRVPIPAQVLKNMHVPANVLLPNLFQSVWRCTGPPQAPNLALQVVIAVDLVNFLHQLGLEISPYLRERTLSGCCAN